MPTKPTDLSSVLSDRLPPHSPEAERGFLGEMIVGGNEPVEAAVEKIGFGLDTFYDLRHQILWGALVEMMRTAVPINAATLHHQLAEGGIAEKAGGIAYIAELAGAAVGAVDYWVEDLVRKRKLRAALRAAMEAAAKVYDEEADPDEIVDELGNKMFDLSDAGASKTRPTVMESIERVQHRIDTLKKGGPQMNGPSSGFHMLDQILCGFGPAQYIVLAARPSMGKSLLAGQFAEYWALELGIPVGIFSLEMDQDSLVERWLFSQSRCDLQRYRSGFFSNQGMPAMVGAMSKLAAAAGKNLIHIDDDVEVGIDQLAMRMRRMHRKGCRLFIVDYLQLLSGSSNRRYSEQNRANELAQVSRTVMRLKKELGVPVIVLAQMNRNIESYDQRHRLPVLADLKDSGQIEQDADVVMFLHEPPLKEALMDPEGEIGKSQLRFLESETAELFPWDWKLKVLTKEQREDRDKKWHKWNHHLRRIDLLVVKQRSGPANCKAELVMAKKWIRFFDAHTPRPKHNLPEQQSLIDHENEEE